MAHRQRDSTPNRLMFLALLSLLPLSLLRALLQRLAADTNLLRLGGFGLRQRQMQDAMLEVRLRLVGIHRRGQRHTAVERPTLALVRDPVLILLVFALVLRRRFTADAQRVALYGDLYIVRLHARHGGRDLE